MSEYIDGNVAMVEVIALLENEIEQLAEINKMLVEALERAQSVIHDEFCSNNHYFHCLKIYDALAKAKETGK